VTEEVVGDLEPEHVVSEGRKRSRLSTSVLGVMLVLTGVVGAILTTRAATQSVGVVAASRDLNKGDVIGESDLELIDVPRSAAKYFISREEAHDVIGTMTVSSVSGGSPLTRNILVRQPALDESMVLVSVPVKIGEYPPMVAPGDDVTVIVSPDATIVDASPPRIVAERLRVWSVNSSTEMGETTVITLVGDADIALEIAGSGSVHLGLVKSSSQ
jgi:Flp pilus assembly protein CpaB